MGNTGFVIPGPCVSKKHGEPGRSRVCEPNSMRLTNSRPSASQLRVVRNDRKLGMTTTLNLFPALSGDLLQFCVQLREVPDQVREQNMFGAAQ